MFCILGGVAWVRKSSKFYKSLTKFNSENNIIAFYTPQFSLSKSEKIDNFNLQPFSPSFIEILNSTSVNYIVKDISSTEYSNISVGNRIFAEESIIPDVAVLGTVIAKETIILGNDLRYKLTARLDSNGSDIVLEDKMVWLLPSQLGQPGT